MGGFWGISGFIIAFLFFPPMVVMNILLFVPVLSQMFGVVMGVDRIPGALTLFGFIIVAIEVNLLYKGE